MEDYSYSKKKSKKSRPPMMIIAFGVLLIGIAGTRIWGNSTEPAFPFKGDTTSNEESESVLGAADDFDFTVELIESIRNDIDLEWESNPQNTIVEYFGVISDTDSTNDSEVLPSKHKLRGLSIVADTYTQEGISNLEQVFSSLEMEFDESNSSEYLSAYKNSEVICIAQKYKSSKNFRISCGQLKK